MVRLLSVVIVVVVAVQVVMEAGRLMLEWYIICSRRKER